MTAGTLTPKLLLNLSCSNSSCYASYWCDMIAGYNDGLRARCYSAPAFVFLLRWKVFQWVSQQYEYNTLQLWQFSDMLILLELYFNISYHPNIIFSGFVIIALQRYRIVFIHISCVYVQTILWSAEFGVYCMSIFIPFKICVHLYISCCVQSNIFLPILNCLSHTTHCYNRTICCILNLLLLNYDS